MPSWNDSNASLPDREAAIRTELAASGGSAVTSIVSDGTITVSNGNGPTATVKLPATGVSAGTYGDATHTLTAIVDANGRITGLSTNAISAGAITLAQALANGNDANGFKITNAGAPTIGSDLTTKTYVDAITRTLAQVLAAGLDANGLVPTNLGTPSNQSDAATKAYVDVLTANLQTGTSYTLQLSDLGKVIEISNAGSITLTIPPNSSVAFPVRSQIKVRQTGVGAITIAGGAGVTVVNAYTASGTPIVTGAQYAAVWLEKAGTNFWYVDGAVA